MMRQAIFEKLLLRKVIWNGPVLHWDKLLQSAELFEIWQLSFHICFRLEHHPISGRTPNTTLLRKRSDGRTVCCEWNLTTPGGKILKVFRWRLFRADIFIRRRNCFREQVTHMWIEDALSKMASESNKPKETLPNFSPCCLRQICIDFNWIFNCFALIPCTGI